MCFIVKNKTIVRMPKLACRQVQGYRDAGIGNQAEDGKAMCDFFGTYTEQNETKAEIAIDFSNFAPNAPEEVRQAFLKAAENREQYDKVMEFINGTNKFQRRGSRTKIRRLTKLVVLW